MTQQQKIDEAAAAVRWDLSDLYADIDDPKLESDLTALLRSMKSFNETHAGNLANTLGDALEAQAEMTCTGDQLMVYLFLRRSTDATNQRIQQRLAQVQEAYAEASANYLTFFEHELSAMDEADYYTLLAKDARVKRHQPMLDHIRENRRYLLEQDVERAIQLRSPYGASEWSDYIDEREAELRFTLDDDAMTLP